MAPFIALAEDLSGSNDIDGAIDVARVPVPEQSPGSRTAPKLRFYLALGASVAFQFDLSPATQHMSPATSNCCPGMRSMSSTTG